MIESIKADLLVFLKEELDKTISNRKSWENGTEYPEEMIKRIPQLKEKELRLINLISYATCHIYSIPVMGEWHEAYAPYENNIPSHVWIIIEDDGMLSEEAKPFVGTPLPARWRDGKSRFNVDWDLSDHPLCGACFESSSQVKLWMARDRPANFTE